VICKLYSLPPVPLLAEFWDELCKMHFFSNRLI
jgi:hypothetical protein